MIDSLLYAIGSVVGHFISFLDVYIGLVVIGWSVHLYRSGGEVIEFLFVITIVITLIFLKVDNGVSGNR